MIKPQSKPPTLGANIFHQNGGVHRLVGLQGFISNDVLKVMGLDFMQFRQIHLLQSHTEDFARLADFIRVAGNEFDVLQDRVGSAVKSFS